MCVGCEWKKIENVWKDVVFRGAVAPINAKTLVRVHWDNSTERFSALLLWDCSCIISTVSAPPWEWPECSIFPQPSIQTWTITARLQRHFCCTQGLAPVNGGYFQSLCCQSKCQVNTGWQTAPLECFTAVSRSPQLCSAIFHTKTPSSNRKAKRTCAHLIYLDKYKNLITMFLLLFVKACILQSVIWFDDQSHLQSSDNQSRNMVHGIVLVLLTDSAPMTPAAHDIS